MKLVCQDCGKVHEVEDQGFPVAWGETYEGSKFIGYLCPTCQKPDEVDLKRL